MILTRIKETAEAHLGYGVTHAVVTVPSRELSQYIVNFLLIEAIFQTSPMLNDRQRRKLVKLLDSRFSES